MPQIADISWLEAYKLRLQRRRLLWRSFRSRRQLTSVVNRTSDIKIGSVLCVLTLRNEMSRLPFLLKYYRDLGVSHFLVVDNASDDGSAELLKEQLDVSLWHTDSSYRASRFGLDWMTWLQIKYAHDHWCLMVDADELLVYPGDDQLKLPELTRQLDEQGQSAFGALMIDLYPKGALGTQDYMAGQDPREVLPWFDAGPYRAERQNPKGNLWMQGGMRERVFFQNAPERSPTLNKLPLVRWNRRNTYVNSCHSILPRELNFAYDGLDGPMASGALLHTKFLPEIVSKSETEKQRQEHFNAPEEFDHYYDLIMQRPNLWNESSVRYTGSEQLVALGLMSKGEMR